MSKTTTPADARTTPTIKLSEPLPPEPVASLACHTIVVSVRARMVRVTYHELSASGAIISAKSKVSPPAAWPELKAILESASKLEDKYAAIMIVLVGAKGKVTP